VFSKKLNAAPQAGTYTVTILGSGDSSIAPTTAGTGTVTITTGGIVKFVGTLGDGTKVSQSTTLSADGQWPFYVSLYSGNGSILGLPVISGNDVTGPVIWFKLAGANDPNYPAGFTFDTTLVGTKN
jgi:hypothetical protein